MTTHNIIMLGGRRAGKTTILASILSQLSDNSPGNICTITDNTGYPIDIETEFGNIALPSLDNKLREVQRYMTDKGNNKERNKNEEFLVDMSPTYGQASYVLEVSANNTALNFKFIDVPGEWMRTNVKDHAKLKELIAESDVFIIAIDTPFLMNTDNPEGIMINSVYNRVTEIEQAMLNMKIDKDIPQDLKQIILCPVKCEKWIQKGKAEEVVDKVCKIYRKLINRWVNCPQVTIQIMPIQTVGGLESSRMLPAQLYFKDDNDRVGETCSVDPLTNMVMLRDGTPGRLNEGSRIEVDKNWEIDYASIPLSWYRINGKGFAPKNCEQPGYHILKFLVEKEENVIAAKAQMEKVKLEEKGLIWRWLTKIFNPTFGKYLPVWKEVITKLNDSRLIKTEGDGFCYIRTTIE